MKNSVLIVAFSAVLFMGCASQQTFTLTPPDGPFCVLDGQDLIGIGNMDGDESWFRMANVLPIQPHRFADGWMVTVVEKDSGVHQDDFEGRSFRRTVEMTARPTSTRVFRTKDGRGIVLIQETSGLGYETLAAEKMGREIVRVLSVNNEETIEWHLADLPNDNIFIIMLANGENEGEIVVRKQRLGSERVFVGITTTLDSVLTLVGVLHLYLPTYEQQPRLHADAEEEAAKREADEIIRELDESDDSKQGE